MQYEKARTRRCIGIKKRSGVDWLLARIAVNFPNRAAVEMS